MFHVGRARVIFALLDGLDLMGVNVLLISASSLSLKGVEHVESSKSVTANVREGNGLHNRLRKRISDRFITQGGGLMRVVDEMR